MNEQEAVSHLSIAMAMLICNVTRLQNACHHVSFSYGVADAFYRPEAAKLRQRPHFHFVSLGNL